MCVLIICKAACLRVPGGVPFPEPLLTSSANIDSSVNAFGHHRSGRQPVPFSTGAARNFRAASTIRLGHISFCNSTYSTRTVPKQPCHHAVPLLHRLRNLSRQVVIQSCCGTKQHSPRWWLLSHAVQPLRSKCNQAIDPSAPPGKVLHRLQSSSLYLSSQQQTAFSFLWKSMLLQPPSQAMVHHLRLSHGSIQAILCPSNTPQPVTRRALWHVLAMFVSSRQVSLLNETLQLLWYPVLALGM